MKYIAFGLGLIVFATIARAVPHLNNFTPVGALALFGGAVFASRLKWGGIMLPILAFALGDLLLALLRPEYPLYNDKGFLFQRIFDFGAMASIYWLGKRLSGLPFSTETALKIGGSAFLGSGIFFLVSNFGVWFGGVISGSGLGYSSDFSGLLQCWQMGLPFYKGTFWGDLLYSLLFFGGYYALKAHQPTSQKV